MRPGSSGMKHGNNLTEVGLMTSIYDVAKAAGVSTTTVSLILNGKGDKLRLSARTQEKVRQAARDLGYVPNVNARRLLRSGGKGFMEIGLLWSPDQHTAFLDTMIRTMTRLRKEEAVFPMHLSIIPFERGYIEEQEELLKGKSFHGLIAVSGDDQDVAYLQSIQVEMPLVLIYQNLEQFYSVNVDNQRNGELAAEIFKNLHFRHVMYIGGSYESRTSSLRKMSFIHKAEELGMQVCVEDRNEEILANLSGEFKTMDSYRYGREIIREILKKQEMPEAVFVQDDDTARGVVVELKRQGIRCPEDVSVIGYGLNTIENQESENSLTLILHPMGQLAMESIRMLDLIIREGEVFPRNILCDSSAFFGKTCRKPDDKIS